MQRVFFHIHIWKTGGTTFVDICRNNFGKGFHRDAMLVQHWSLSTQQLRWLLTSHNWIRCYSCHMPSGDLPYDVSGTEVIGIAFVRNPVNRFISSYNSQKTHRFIGGFAKDASFDEVYVKALVDAAHFPLWRNGQTFVLGGSDTENGLAKISERVKNGQIVLLSTERFDESCILLERLFPGDFKDCTYTRKKNVSKHSEVVSEHQRTAISKYMDIDFKLLTFANDYLDSTLDRLFPNLNERQQYIDDFRHRCHLKKQRQRVTYLLRYPHRAIKAAFKKIINLT